MSERTKPKAVALISGGLDSMLATKLILDQGIHVEGLNFYTGFCHSGHTSAIRNQGDKHKPKRNDALWVAEQLGIKLHIIDIVDEYKNVVLKPKHGYGQHMNPCLDCKIFMVSRAKQWLEANDFDFIITGEVAGQRPKSQRKKYLVQVGEQTKTNERLLRPLSAKLLAPTLPEREGWVDRERLCDFSGRSRKPQIALAKQYNFIDYAQPSGGCCVLTDESYAEKLRDLLRMRCQRDYDLDDITLLKVGRHLRPKRNFKLIIGRDKGENNFLAGYRKQFSYLRTVDHEGPLVLIDGEPTTDDFELAAKLTARFSQGRNAEKVTVAIKPLTAELQTLTVKPLLPTEVPQEWYV